MPIAGDLAPGDRRAAGFDWTRVVVRRVSGADDPEFAPAYDRLWAEFGARGEMERRSVIEARLGWDPRRPAGGVALLYEILVVRCGDALVAVRDHTAVLRVDDPTAPAVLHLSHVVVEPAWRGSGLAAWLRAFPLQTARRCAAAAGRESSAGTPSPAAGVVLVAEMEHPDPGDPATMLRLGAYERAGFRKVAPDVLPFRQPDFRPPDALAGSTPVPVPLALVVRRVGREAETTMPVAEVAAVTDAVYAVYGMHVPPHALEPLARDVRAALRGRVSVPLVAPTA